MSQRTFDLHGKKAIVSACDHPVAQDIALALAYLGVTVSLWGEDARTLDNLATGIQACGGTAWTQPVPLDASAPEIHTAMNKACASMESLDIFVNTIHKSAMGNPLETTAETYEAMVTLPLRSAFFSAQAAALQMHKAGHGKLIMLSAQSASVAMPSFCLEGMRMAAIENMTRSLALELAPQQITVNAIALGLDPEMAAQACNSNPAFAKGYANNMLCPPAANKEALAAAIAYLGSSAADMVTGQIIRLDGGWTIH